VQRALVLCDGARPRLDVAEFDQTISLAHRGRNASVNLNIESPATKLFERIPGRALDLITIAAYAYAADQEIRRGGEADVYGDSWRRDITLAIPVIDKKFWSEADVVERLTEALQFASGDVWRFRFTRARPRVKQFGLDIKSNETVGRPDCLFLFSGGLDSLCAVVEELRQGAGQSWSGTRQRFMWAADSVSCRQFCVRICRGGISPI
jgi:hypothetical protein